MSDSTPPSLAGIPQVLLKCLEVCESGTEERRQLALVCMLDAGLSLSVLAAAGRTRFPAGFGASVEEAVKRLGNAALRQLMVAMLVKQYALPTQENGLEQLLDIWRHSLRCAFIARRLAQATELVPADEAYLAGLIHDVGKLAIPDSGWPVSAPEGRHAGIGALLVEQATGSTLLADAVRYHHESAERVRWAFGLVRIVYLANRLAHERQDASPGTVELAARLCGVAAGVLSRIQARAAEDFRGALRFLAMPPDEKSETGSAVSGGRHAVLQLCRREVEDRSLLSAGLQSLMGAAPRNEALLRSLADGLKIHFNIKRVLFFLPDGGRERLLPAAVTGCSRLPQGLSVGVGKPARGMLARCFAEGLVTDSYGMHGRCEATIADEQVLHLLGSEGICCAPLLYLKKCLGIVVMGAGPEGVKGLHQGAGLLKKLTGSTARCLAAKVPAAQRRTAREGGESALAPRRMLHEVNNPLGIIKNYLRLLGQKLPPDHDGRRDLQLVLEEIDRITLILKRYASEESLEEGARHPIDLNRRLAAFFKVLEKALLKPRAIVLHTDLDPSLPAVSTDWNALKQILLNLVKNAVEAMPRGGKLFVSTRRIPPLKGAAQKRRQSGVEITVADTGTGIDPAVAQKLLEPGVSSRKGDHAGLGLYVVRRLVQTLGGKLRFGSQPGKGSAFRIFLPL